MPFCWSAKIVHQIGIRHFRNHQRADAVAAS
jgi:hypothetical protein